MKRTIPILILATLNTGCAVKFSAELLNPLNKSGREEVSRPVKAPTPSPTPAPGGVQ